MTADAQVFVSLRVLSAENPHQRGLQPSFYRMRPFGPIGHRGSRRETEHRRRGATGRLPASAGVTPIGVSRRCGIRIGWGGIRTLTNMILNHVPLPIGLPSRMGGGGIDPLVEPLHLFNDTSFTGCRGDHHPRMRREGFEPSLARS